MRSRLSRLPLAAVIALALFAQTVPADELQDINKLVTKGQLTQALERVNAYLTTHPKDAQARFTRGIVLTELNRPTEAIQAFTGLTEDYPELPEPYNNLAVIYAAQGDYDKARNALELAIHTHPSYATAHENLGDIYAKLASRSYDKALQLDRSNTAVQTKLALIKDMFAPVKAPAEAAKPEPAKVEHAKSDTPKPEPVKPDVPTEAPKAEPAKSGTDTAKAAGAAAAATAAADATADTTGRSDAVVATVMAWAQDWSDKRPDAYLAHYSAAFRPPNQESRTAWEKQRRDRLSKPGPIVVKVREPRVTFPAADRALVTFQQDYTSATLKTTNRKSLLLMKDGDKWQILQEQVGS